MTILFHTVRLAVRRLKEADAGFMLALLNDPGWLANIGDRGVRTISQADTYIEDRLTADYCRAGMGYFVVEARASETPVGTVSLVRRPGLDGPDLGFAFLADQCRRGLGEEAARGLIAWAGEALGPAVLGAGPLLAITALDNPASIRLLAKLGFAAQGIVALPGHAEGSRLFARPWDFRTRRNNL